MEKNMTNKKNSLHLINCHLVKKHVNDRSSKIVILTGVHIFSTIILAKYAMFLILNADEGRAE